jgi:protein-tyrosine phosphatase
MKPDLFWIPGPWRGRLAVATRPRGGEWLEDEASGWRRAGIDVIVSLLEEGEAVQLDLVDEAKAMGANGIRFISFPIPDRGVPASAPAAATLIAAISDALERGDNIAVHCRQSVGRSGLIAAGVLASAGIDPERAIEVVSSARGQTVPETPGQRAWVQRLPSRLAGVPQPTSL